MDEHKRRFWRSPCGHVQGEVQQILARPGRPASGYVTTLLLYEQSQPSEPAERPPARIRVWGDGTEIRCTICGVSHHWYSSEEALRRLLTRRRARLKCAEAVL